MFRLSSVHMLQRQALILAIVRAIRVKVHTTPKGSKGAVEMERRSQGGSKEVVWVNLLAWNRAW